MDFGTLDIDDVRTRKDGVEVLDVVTKAATFWAKIEM